MEGKKMTVAVTVLPIEHIVYDEKKKQPMLRGTRYTVAFLATFLDDPEWTVERMVESYPLTPAQIHAAWSYYYDHKPEIDALLEQEAKRDEQAPIALHSAPKYTEAIARRAAKKKKGDQ
jgi:uncharacterized protein (DUF433 family)